MERKTGIIEVRGREYSIKELTTAQIESVMEEIESGNYTGHLFDALFDHGLPANAFFKAIGIEEKEFDKDLSPTEVDALYQKVVDVNPLCAVMMKKLYKAGIRLQQSEQPPSS